jgi:hypothetical protein
MVLRRTDRKPWPPSVLAKLAKANTVQCEVGAATQRLHEHSEADVRITPRYDAIAPQLREKFNSRNGMCCCCGVVLGNASVSRGSRRGHGRNEKNTAEAELAKKLNTNHTEEPSTHRQLVSGTFFA